VAVGEGEFEPPRTPVEEMMAMIWKRVLGIENVGIEDNFFELGGHSLLATQVVSQVRKTFQVELPLRQFFEAPTLSSLANYVEETRKSGRGVSAPPIEPVSREGDLPLSYAQNQLWFLDQFEPNSSVYNMHAAIGFSGQLQVTALEESFGEIQRRHETLRTRLPQRDGQPIQIISEPRPYSLPLTDLTGLSEGERESEARRLAIEGAGIPFDLANGPLVRISLLRLGPGDHILLLTMHHIISDGWSLNILMQELSTLYHSFCAGHISPLPELSIAVATGGSPGQAGKLLEAAARRRSRCAGAPHG
jgi:acyl carrier protein